MAYTKTDRKWGIFPDLSAPSHSVAWSWMGKLNKSNLIKIKQG